MRYNYHKCYLPHSKTYQLGPPKIDWDLIRKAARYNRGDILQTAAIAEQIRSLLRSTNSSHPFRNIPRSFVSLRGLGVGTVMFEYPVNENKVLKANVPSCGGKK